MQLVEHKKLLRIAEDLGCQRTQSETLPCCMIKRLQTSRSCVQICQCFALQTAAMSASVQVRSTVGPACELSEVWRNIQQTHEKARQTGAAYKTDTSTQMLEDRSLGQAVTFVLRVAAALRDKPKGPKDGDRCGTCYALPSALLLSHAITDTSAE